MKINFIHWEKKINRIDVPEVFRTTDNIYCRVIGKDLSNPQDDAEDQEEIDKQVLCVSVDSSSRICFRDLSYYKYEFEKNKFEAITADEFIEATSDIFQAYQSINLIKF